MSQNIRRDYRNYRRKHKACPTYHYVCNRNTTRESAKLDWLLSLQFVK